MTKKIAFTLAEVLITLGIIGVVSAMTIPTLIHKYKNDEYVAGMKKIYATLSQAVLSAKEQAGLEKLGNTSPDMIRNQLDCIGNKDVSDLSYVTSGSWNREGSGCILANGMEISIVSASDNRYLYGIAAVDTNGERQPNEFGRDRWVYLIVQDGRVIPSGAEVRDNDTGNLIEYSEFGLGSYSYNTNPCWSCGGRLLKNNWHMDY